MSAATPEDLANGIKLLERLRTGELNLIPAMGIPSKQDASTAMLQRVEDVLRAAYKRVAEPVGDGGPALPRITEIQTPNSIDWEQPRYSKVRSTDGMTLRDYFAAKAMQAEMITTFSDATPEAAEEFAAAAGAAGREVENHLAFNAYLIAEAMLKARQA